MISADIREIIPTVGKKIGVMGCLEQGWEPVSVKGRSINDFTFCCFTRRVPQKKPPTTPGGLDRSTPKQLAEWEADSWAQSPYQYARSNNVWNRRVGGERRLLIVEEEWVVGVPPISRYNF